MPAWVLQILESPALGPATLAAVLVVGVVGSLSTPCNLAFVAAIVAYAGSLSETRGRRGIVLAGVSFIVGTVLVVAALGVVIGLIGNVVSAYVGPYWRLIAGLLMVFIGLVCLGLAPFRLPSFSLREAPRRGGLLEPMLYGLAVGGAAVVCAVCCNPLLLVVMGYATLHGSVAWSATVLAVFALGYSLPLAAVLVGLALGLGKLREAAQKIGPVVRVVAGVLLIGVGFYMLATAGDEMARPAEADEACPAHVAAPAEAALDIEITYCLE
ncbi:MAG: sulfite exporter TauE/SafE family protein [Candidatus Coatesbacteria bacterium]|nr:MAG: sulfite exporter TauE/SafE family protein [Candidatus Coatesbacteria bacterium]